MRKIHLLNAVAVLALIFAFSGCGNHSQPTSSTSSTQSSQTSQSTTSTSSSTSTSTSTNSSTSRHIEVELDMVGAETYGLVGIGQLEGSGTAAEIVVNGSIYSTRNANASVKMTAEFFNASRVSVGTAELKMILFGAIDLDYKEFAIKYNQNPSQVESCILTVTAYEGVE
jgi:cytoskeletal protein RodZ